MAVLTFPHILLESTLRELRARPDLVATGPLGLNRRGMRGEELLVRTIRLAGEPELRSGSPGSEPRLELGFVPFSLRRPRLVEIAREPNSDPAPVCRVLLGIGRESGLFAGWWLAGEAAVPVTELAIPGPGMREVRGLLAPAPDRGPARAPDGADPVRWSRLLGALGDAALFERLRRLRVTVLGAGAAGSLLVEALARAGLRELTVVDPDRLELHNLPRMALVREEHLGLPKVTALARATAGVFADLSLRPVCAELASAAGLAAVQTAAVVACCVDNDARLPAALLAVAYHRPLLELGTGVFNAGFAGPDGSPLAERVLAAEVRLLLPGSGCAACAGLRGDLRAALGTRVPVPEPDWRRARSGSFAHLNALAVSVATGLLVDLVAGRVTTSVLARYDVDPTGLPVLRSRPIPRRPGCRLCALAGRADDLLP